MCNRALVIAPLPVGVGTYFIEMPHAEKKKVPDLGLPLFSAPTVVVLSSFGKNDVILL